MLVHNKQLLSPMQAPSLSFAGKTLAFAARRTCDAVGLAAVRNAMLRDLLKVCTSRAPRALEDIALPGYLE